MSNRNVDLKDFDGNKLIPDINGIDGLTGESGSFLQTFSEIITSNIMEKVLSIIPLRYHVYLQHDATSRNNQIKTNHVYQNYNFGVTAPSLNQNNSVYTTVNWLEFIKTDPTLTYYDAIKIHLERDSFLNVRSIMYFSDSNASAEDRVFSRITIKSADGVTLEEPTVVQTMPINGRESLAVEACHKISDGALITLSAYGLTSYTISRLILYIDVQEVINGKLMMR